MPRQIKIGELEPTTRGELALVFEVHEVMELAQSEGRETVLCRIVDETGIITALFDQYATKFTVGTVFEIQNFKCKVVAHHLRLEMIKTTVVAKQPLKMGFKDLENDLSAKFYTAATKPPQTEKTESLENPLKKQETTPKIEEKPKVSEGKEKNNSKEDKNKGSKDKKQKETKIEKKPERKQSSDQDVSKRNEKKQEKKQEKRERKNGGREQVKEEKQEGKKIYKQKKAEQQRGKEGDKQPHKPKFVPKYKQIRISQCPDHQEEEVTFIARVNLKSAIKHEKYTLCRVSDASGSTYFEFSPSAEQELKDKTWYRLTAFKVFRDKEYGYIATQEKHSSYELLPDWDEKVDTRLLWR